MSGDVLIGGTEVGEEIASVGEVGGWVGSEDFLVRVGGAGSAV